MKNQTPKLVVYGRSYEEAMDVVWSRRLRNCEPVAVPMLGLLFSTDADLVLFCLMFRNESVFEQSLAILASHHKAEVHEFLQNQSMAERVQQSDLLGVWFWSDEDEIAFNKGLGIETIQP